jgi:isopenicillin-N N-acyltransferase like protein
VSAPYVLEQICCAGSPRELGRQHGEQLRDKIRAFVAERLEALDAYLGERGKPGQVLAVLEAGRGCLAVAERWHPAGYAEHLGIAEAAGVDAGKLYTIANMTDVRDIVAYVRRAADREGCSSLLVPPALSADGALLAAQTWDLNPADLEFVVAVRREPERGPQTWSITCSGCLSLIGMNADGLAVGTNNLKLKGGRVGVGYLSLQHRALECRTREDAARVHLEAPRAAAHSYWIADPEGALELECSAAECVRRDLGNQPLARTNHCLSRLVEEEGEPHNASTEARLARLERWLAGGAQSFDSLRALFSDRSDGVNSVCRYPEDGQGTATNACILMAPERRELWACRGPADRGVWVRLTFS